MPAIACNAAAAEEAEDGQLPGSSSEAEATGEAVPVLAAAQATNSSKDGRWVKNKISLERACTCTVANSQPFLCRLLWLDRQSLLHALKAKHICRALPLRFICMGAPMRSCLHCVHLIPSR